MSACKWVKREGAGWAGGVRAVIIRAHCGGHDSPSQDTCRPGDDGEMVWTAAQIYRVVLTRFELTLSSSL